MGILYEWGERGKEGGCGEGGKREGRKKGEEGECKEAKVKQGGLGL